ncbi:MAG: threonylcarbamoyl-AMP synthase [Actinobacteria bacterium HGW-Actinobacteria-2]|nr:MAG: threonylcarbamoyl-AMP synthase [Actinobacteria bacterium HGW-Actinobacteria-2]
MPRVFDISTDREAAIDAAAAAVADGKCIVLPTDTVYGIGANAFDPDAVQRLLHAKQRGRDMPPPVLIADVMALRTLADVVTNDIDAAAEAWWPGALTMVVRAQPSLRLNLGERGGTVAVRIPDHEFTRALLRATGPLAVSSANVTGEPAATTIAEAQDQLKKSVAVYLDGGPAAEPVPSTIIDLTDDIPRVLRLGRISMEQLTDVFPGLAEG